MTYRMPDPDILIKMFEDFDKMEKDDLVATLTLNCCVAGALQISGVIPPKEYDRLSKKMRQCGTARFSKEGVEGTV